MLDADEVTVLDPELLAELLPVIDAVLLALLVTLLDPDELPVLVPVADTVLLAVDEADDDGVAAVPPALDGAGVLARQLVLQRHVVRPQQRRPPDRHVVAVDLDAIDATKI